MSSLLQDETVGETTCSGGVPGALCKPFKREITATTTTELPCCELTATQQETTTLHRQHVGPLGWVPSGEKKKGGEGVWRVGGEREREKNRAKRKCFNAAGEDEPCSSLKLPRQPLSPLLTLQEALGSQGSGWLCYPNSEQCSAVTPTSLHSSPWSSVLCRGEKDEQICLESCPWAIPVASATIWTVSPVYLCLFHVVSFLGPDCDPASLCSGVKVLYCFSGGFKEMRKNLSFLLGKIVCKHLRRILLGFLNRFLGLGWAQGVSYLGKRLSCEKPGTYKNPSNSAFSTHTFPIISNSTSSSLRVMRRFELS